MAERLTQRDLRNNIARVVDEVVADKTFVVTRNGRPVAELRPVTRQRLTFIARHELVELASRAEHIDRRRFRADLDEAIDQRL